MGKMKGWRYYRSQAKKWGDRAFVIANSLHKYPPNGLNPVTKKKYSTSKAFVTALQSADKKREYYTDMMKKAYKKNTGKNW